MDGLKKLTLISFFICTMVICISCSREEEVITNQEPITAEVSQDINVVENISVIEERSDRDKDWEEDINYIVKILLKIGGGHPLLVDYPTYIQTERSYFTGDYTSKIGKFYDETLRERFMQKIDTLLFNIPQLEDYEIEYGLHEAIAILNDLHTSIFLYSEIYPFFFTPFYEEGIQFFVTRVTEGAEDLLYSRLEEINGVSVEEILEQFKKIVPYENEYNFTSSVSYTYLSFHRALQYIGVVNDKGAEFTFIDRDGSRKTVYKEPISIEEKGSIEWVTQEYSGTLEFSKQYPEKNYWYEYLADKDIIYMRYRRCRTDEDITFWNWFQELTEVIKDKNGVSKVVMDVRGNTGGYVPAYYGNMIQWLKNNKDLVNGIDLLIDEGTYSAGIIFSSLLKKNVDYVTMIGNGGGQSPNFFAGVSSYVSPRLNISLSVSKDFINAWPEYEEETLMPDILITPTIEDYMNNIDTVLEAVLNE